MIAGLSARRRANTRLKWFAVVAVLLAVFIGANVHLVYVAVQSQPECVLDPALDSASLLRPARPAC
ncbi:MAG: hypothetical protein E5V58_05925 [Mesorhizobium sp.]|nr:hypothetical protein EN738_11795 [Mesorhizobium sp. M4B.F.Ca.ET.017.02.2.1]RWC94541.1 MAG: hypothetical protein EOS32_16725 [Mesorhizobium sp.]RWX67823.1 hypothetical protein EN780_11115 [Mesorhizobium sp. M4B.F.Ca.ET.089.01.1.1]TIW74503.1 MAG: hypothetical protein E5V58_05925 [Mesorhizobium sp.]